jgi:hypothetical protein
MKKITRFFFIAVAILASVNLAKAQATIDFETVGQDWTWTLFENGTNDASLYSVVANPSATGINTSAHCAKYIVNANGQPWAGLWTSSCGDLVITANNCLIKIMVYKDVISNFDLKLENGAYTYEKQVPNTKVNEWEEISFDFSSQIGQTFKVMTIIPDFPTTRTAGSTNYFDNISFHAGSTPPPSNPTVAAPTPTVPAANVISMFSNAYTNVNVDTWRTDWSSGSDLTDLQIAGNDAKKYSNLSYFGIETTGANLIDATNMDHFHLDYWTADATTFKVKLVDFGANGVWSGGDDVESELTFTPIAYTWNSIDIPLSNFTTLTTKAHLAQYIMSGTAGSTVYIDNMYFYKKPATEPTTAAPTPTVASSDVISMFSNAYTNVGVDTWRTSWSAGSDLTDLQIAGNDTKKYSNLSFFGIETTGANLINATAMNYFHFDVWTPDAVLFKVKLVDFGADAAWGGGDDVEYELSLSPALSSWNSFNLPLSDFTNLTTRGHIAQLIFSGSTGATVYLDNIYFSKVTTGVKEVIANNAIKAYPNPVLNNYTISANSEIQQITVRNLLGQTIKNQTLNCIEKTIDLSNLASGNYLVTVKLANGQQAVQKFVKL